MQVLVADLAHRLGVEPTPAAINAALNPPVPIPKRYTEWTGPSTAAPNSEAIDDLARFARQPKTPPGW